VDKGCKFSVQQPSTLSVVEVNNLAFKQKNQKFLGNFFRIKKNNSVKRGFLFWIFFILISMKTQANSGIIE
jgi:hypothetical protein